MGAVSPLRAPQGFLHSGLRKETTGGTEGGVTEVMVAWSVPTEADLVARAQTGDEAAFEELVGSTQARLFSLAARLLASRSEAQDVVQEAYIVAYTHLHQLDPTRSPMGWLGTVTTRLCLNRLRSAKRLVPLESMKELMTEGNEGQIQLQEALGSLPEEARAVILLHYWGGYSCKEMSDMLERGESAVKVQLFRARERLRQWFQS